MFRYILFTAIALIVIVPCVIFFIRVKMFRPNPDKNEQLRRLNADLLPTGFAYDSRGDFFFSLKNCWQREAGYCRIYDEGAPMFNMIMDCEPITFSYNGKRWLIELWKGQYGITTGAEIGVYNTDSPDVVSDRFTGAFYEAAAEEEELDMSFVLYKNGKKLIKRSDKTWWLTAFKLGEFSDRETLVMRARIRFPDRGMLAAFVAALTRAGYGNNEFSVSRGSVTINYTVPHCTQPASQEGFGEISVRRINKTNCGIYSAATAGFSCTPDKIEYLRSFMPELYDFTLRSLYGKEFFKTFEWLLQLIRGKKPAPPKPEPPCEIKPPKPEPPCGHSRGGADGFPEFIDYGDL